MVVVPFCTIRNTLSNVVFEFEIATLGCINNYICWKSATFTSHFFKAESVCNIHGVSCIFVCPFCKTPLIHQILSTEVASSLM